MILCFNVIHTKQMLQNMFSLSLRLVPLIDIHALKKSQKSNEEKVVTILGGSLNLDTWPDGTHVTMYIDPKQKVWFINVGKDQEFQEKALKMLKLSATLWRANDQPSKHLPPERRSRAPFLKQQPPRHAASSQQPPPQCQQPPPRHQQRPPRHQQPLPRHQQRSPRHQQPPPPAAASSSSHCCLPSSFAELDIEAIGGRCTDWRGMASLSSSATAWLAGWLAGWRANLLRSNFSIATVSFSVTFHSPV